MSPACTGGENKLPKKSENRTWGKVGEGRGRRFECGFSTWRTVARQKERRSISRSITPRPKVYEEIWSRERGADQCASSLLVTVRTKRADYEVDLGGPIQKASVQQNFQFGKQFTLLQYLKKFSQSVDNSKDYIFTLFKKQWLFSMDKKPTRCHFCVILYFSFTSCSTCFGQPCAHLQELTTA